MADLDEPVRNQMRNIEAKTGRSMDEWVRLTDAAELDEEVVGWLPESYERA